MAQSNILKGNDDSLFNIHFIQESNEDKMIFLISQLLPYSIS